MYSPIQLAIKYFRYQLTALNGKGHGMHSPFVFDLITKVMNDRTDYPDYDKVEGLRRRLLRDERTLNIEDHGAGSSINKSATRTVASIAKHAAKPGKFGQLLYRIIMHYQPATIIELGTSLGITTSYLSLAKTDARIITMEGASAVAELARQNFRELQLTNTSLVEGNFDQRLQETLSRINTVDLVFIDGNHRLEPTLDYFHQLLAKVHAGSILVFDDIHWSPEMEEAWQAICAHEKVTCTVDLFFIGLVFFRTEFKERQHFSIRF